MQVHPPRLFLQAETSVWASGWCLTSQCGVHLCAECEQQMLLYGSTSCAVKLRNKDTGVAWSSVLVALVVREQLDGVARFARATHAVQGVPESKPRLHDASQCELCKQSDVASPLHYRLFCTSVAGHAAKAVLVHVDQRLHQHLLCQRATFSLRVSYLSPLLTKHRHSGSFQGLSSLRGPCLEA